MKQLLFSALLMISIFASSCSRDNEIASRSPGPTHETITDIEQSLLRAELEKVADTASGAWAERWLADDFVSTGPDGVVTSDAKKQILQNIRSGAWKVESIALDNINVRTFGDAAIVTATQTESSRLDGRDSGGRYQYTHVWARRSGGWQVVAAHITRLSANQ